RVGRRDDRLHRDRPRAARHVGEGRRVRSRRLRDRRIGNRRLGPPRSRRASGHGVSAAARGALDEGSGAPAEPPRREPHAGCRRRHHGARSRRPHHRRPEAVPLQESQHALRRLGARRRARDDGGGRPRGGGVTPAVLVLRDGRVFRGRALGAVGKASGEVIFNTAMSGYQEILTDPSYRGQIVAMTYPLIGNYGINEEDVESRRPWVNGFIVKEASPFPSSWRRRIGLDDYLKTHGIVGIQGIDTRALTRHLRDHGAQDGIIGAAADEARLVEEARALPSLIGRDLVKEVTTETSFHWTEGAWDLARGYQAAPKSE